MAGSLARSHNWLMATARRLPGWPAPALILMYHRVVDLTADPQLLAVRPAHFAQQLDVLRRTRRILSLAELAGAIRDDRVPRRGVVVTLDDGYADNVHHALPALQQADAPAAYFVTTAQVGAPREFWWDELERLVLLPGRLPEVLTLRTNGGSRSWPLGGAAAYTATEADRHRGWDIEHAGNPTPRHLLYRELYALLHPLAEADKRRILDDLHALAGSPPEARPTHRAMTDAELRRVADEGLVEVGAHSETHPALAGLPLPGQEHEIAGSKAMLEAVLDRPVRSFAYPHGSYTDETVRLVRRAGFERAVTSDPSGVRQNGDSLRLPRVVPRDWDGDRFAAWLRAWTA